jgi:vacuolar iron transporter family protein
MRHLRRHPEKHLVGRIGWLKAAVLGANDGIFSTANLIVGVAAAAATQNAVLVAGIAGLVAGAMSMAAGEYVSVSSQSDTEQADLARERKELRDNAAFELDELAEIYVKRGADRALARQVAQQLTAKGALIAHARDELGISEITTARPVQAALTSAATFSAGAVMPLLMVVVSPAGALVPIVSAASLGFLALLGAIGARAGGANVVRATARVTFWGALAMALTAGIGKLFGTVVLRIGTAQVYFICLQSRAPIRKRQVTSSRPRRQMVLSDRNDGARLRALLAFARMHGETHLISRRELVEALVGNRIAMEVDFRTIARIDEPIALLGNETADPAIDRDLMSLDVSALAASIVLELSAHGIEAIAHRDIDVFVSVVLGRITLHHDLPARNFEIDANVIEAALVMAPAGLPAHAAS